MWRWLCDENPDERDEDGKFSWEIFQLDGQWINHQGDDRDQLKKLWRDVEGDVLAYWIPLHPGTRPRMWWRYSAPRIPVGQWPGCYFDGKLPEPRALLGGAGCPSSNDSTTLPRSRWDFPTGGKASIPKMPRCSRRKLLTSGVTSC